MTGYVSTPGLGGPILHLFIRHQKADMSTSELIKAAEDEWGMLEGDATIHVQKETQRMRRDLAMYYARGAWHLSAATAAKYLCAGAQ